MSSAVLPVSAASLPTWKIKHQLSSTASAWGSRRGPRLDCAHGRGITARLSPLASRPPPLRENPLASTRRPASLARLRPHARLCFVSASVRLQRHRGALSLLCVSRWMRRRCVVARLQPHARLYGCALRRHRFACGNCAPCACACMCIGRGDAAASPACCGSPVAGVDASIRCTVGRQRLFSMIVR